MTSFKRIYHNAVQAALLIVKQEGVLGLYSGFAVSLLREAW